MSYPLNYQKATDYYGHDYCNNCQYSEKSYDKGSDKVRYKCWYGLSDEYALNINPLHICDNYKEEESLF